MRYCRFEFAGLHRYGLIESIAGREEITREFRTPPDGGNGDIEDLPTARIRRIPLAEAILLAPVRPTKIICVGRNYREHAAELGNEVPAEPLIFLKPPSSLLAPGGNIVTPRMSERVDFEGELGVVISRPCHAIADDDDVRAYILGYTCVNDVTARDLQKKDGQWTRAKGFDTFCPVGPVVTDEIDPSSGVALETRVNGETRQRGNTRDLIFGVDIIIRYISRIMTLLPGDLISTGTPSGVGPLNGGDVVEVSVDGIGSLRNIVIDETDRRD